MERGREGGKQEENSEGEKRERRRQERRAAREAEDSRREGGRRRRQEGRKKGEEGQGRKRRETTKQKKTGQRERETRSRGRHQRILNNRWFLQFTRVDKPTHELMLTVSLIHCAISCGSHKKSKTTQERVTHSLHHRRKHRPWKTEEASHVTLALHIDPHARTPTPPPQPHTHTHTFPTMDCLDWEP